MQTRFFVYGLIVSLLVWFVPGGMPPGVVAASLPPSAEVSSALQQFTAGGHVVGFRPGGMLLAAADHALRVEFVGARPVIPAAQALPDSSVPVDSRSLSDFESLRSVGIPSSVSAPPLGVVTYAGLWEGVTLTYEHTAGGVVKSTFYVGTLAGSNVETFRLSNVPAFERIRLRYNVPVQVDAGGNLVLAFGTGQLRESAPVAWQEIEGQRVPVNVAFRLLGEREVGFSVGIYDTAYPLVIDPTVIWNTFMGSTDTDYGGSIAVDGAGNVYVVGTSYATWGAPVRLFAGGYDAFVAKLNGNGVRQWLTFLGGTSWDYGHGIAVDEAAEKVYAVGDSYATWGTPPNPIAGPMDAFVAQLNSSDGDLQWNIFLGGTGGDYGTQIALDGTGNLYVAGASEATWGTPVNDYASGYDAFVAKLNSSGDLQWHTFLGGAGNDYGRAVAVDEDGENVYVAGDSTATWGSPVNLFIGGIRDAFTAKLNGSGDLQWHTFLGGAGGDESYGVAADGNGNVYVSGQSPSSWGSPVNLYAGDWDVFVAQLDSSGVRQWHTFLGSTGTDNGGVIALDADGRVYVVGSSTATWGRPINAHTGGNDAFVAQLNGSTGVRQWNTFLGAAGDDSGADVAVDKAGNVHVVGYSDATWGTPLNAHAGGWDAFVAKLHAVMLAGVAVSGPGVGLVGTSYPFTATVSPITATVPITYVWQAVEHTPTMVTHTNSLSDSISFAWGTTGIKSITVTADNAISGTVTGAMTTTITTTATSQLACYLPVLLKDCNADAYEPNDIAAQAYTLTTNTTLAANFCGDDTKDEFKFHIDSLGKTIGITMTQVPAGSNYDLYLHLMPNTGKAVAQSIKTGNADEHISYSPTQTGDYLVYVYAQTKGPSAGRQDYRLEVTFK